MSENKTFEEQFIVDQGPESNKAKEFNILFISDIHLNFNFLEKLKDWQMSNKILLDYLICGGDFLNLNEVDQKDATIISKSEGELSSIINFLECICLNVLYIPGNHDPVTLFNCKSPKLTVRSVNLHNRFHQLDKDLFIFGYGGSIPCYASLKSINETNFYEDIDWNNVFYTGYPINDKDYCYSDSQFFEIFKKEWERAKAELENEKKILGQTILLSHTGPFYSATTINTDANRYVYMGSKNLNNFVKSSENILLNLHGHTHGGRGLINLGGATVLNPGGFTTGNISTLKLKRDYTNEWMVEKIEFINLDTGEK